MHVKKVDKFAMVQLAGIDVNGLVEGSVIKTLTLRDDKGNVVVVNPGSYGQGLDVLVQIPPPKVKRWALTGTVLGLPVAELFDALHKAEDRRRELERHSSDDAMDVKVNEVDVDEDAPVSGPPPDDDVPF